MAGILGVVILALYGDRRSYYQDPVTYHQGYTKLTPLGQMQEVQLGSYLRSEYLNPRSPNSIRGIVPDIVDNRQLLVRADNGGEGGAIVDSAVALLQGLYPPTPNSRVQLANGSNVIGPMGGYQYIPVESVEPGQSIQLEGWTACPNFEKRVKDLYGSPAFRSKANEATPFLNAVRPYLWGIPNTLENMWNVYDYIFTNYVHNETYAFRLPPTFLQQAQAWVDYHESLIFSDTNPTGIGNIAGRTILPSIITSLERISNKADPLSLVVQEISYKPLISLFNITHASDSNPNLKGLPLYASALALEIRNDEEGETWIRAKFKNGTGDFETVHMYGHNGDIALNELIYRFDLTAIKNTQHWCRVCGQRNERGCNLCSADDTLDFSTLESCANKIKEFSVSPSAGIIAAAAFVVLALFGTAKMIRARRASPRVPYDSPILNTQYQDEDPKAANGRY